MKTYNTVVTSKEVEVLNDVASRCPSEKAIAVFGETKVIKDELKKLGGKFNKQADKVRALLAPSVEPAESLLSECKEEFAEMIQESKNAIELVKDSIEETECELISNIQANGKGTNLYLYSYAGAHISDYMTGIYYYVDGLTYESAFELAEAFNEYRGRRVCSDGSDELRINFGSIDEAILFEEWINNKVVAKDHPNEEVQESITLPELPKEIDITDVLDEMETKQESDRIAFAKASKAFIQEWRANNPYPGSDHLDEFNAKFNRDCSAFANKYGVSSYIVPSPYPVERGEYKETELDREKKAADILVESIDGNWYTIRLNREIEIKSKRIRKYDNGCIAVPESMYYKLKDKYNVMCNF